MENAFKERLQNLVRNTSVHKENRVEENTAFQSNFEEKFSEISNNILSPLIKSINHEIASSGSIINLITNENILNNKVDNRFFAQITYFKNNKNINILEAPYLLVEGYPTSGTIRIVESKNSQPGKELKIEEVKEDDFEQVLFNFLEKNLTK
jgi:hypothetical protein